jgi:hypothetical protein
MGKKRTLVMVPLTDEQRAALQPLLDSVERSNGDMMDVAIFAQVWSDGIVATVCTEDEVRGVQAVLQPNNPWRGHATAEGRMRSHQLANSLDDADLAHL